MRWLIRGLLVVVLVFLAVRAVAPPARAVGFHLYVARREKGPSGHRSCFRNPEVSIEPMSGDGVLLNGETIRREALGRRLQTMMARRDERSCMIRGGGDLQVRELIETIDSLGEACEDVVLLTPAVEAGDGCLVYVPPFYDLSGSNALIEMREYPWWKMW